MKISKALEELKALEKLSGTGKQVVIRSKYQITWRDKQILDRMTSERIAKMFKDDASKGEKQ